MKQINTFSIKTYCIYFVLFLIGITQISCVGTSELREAAALKKNNFSFASTMDLSFVYIPKSSGIISTPSLVLPAYGNSFNLGYGLTNKLDALIDLDLKQSRVGAKYQLLESMNADFSVGLNLQSNIGEYLNDQSSNKKIELHYHNLLSGYLTLKRKKHKVLFNAHISPKYHSFTVGIKKQINRESSYSLGFSLIQYKPSIGLNYEFAFYDIFKGKKKRKKKRKKQRPTIDEF